MPMVLCVAFACVALAELLIEPGSSATSATRAWNRRWVWWGLWIVLGLGFLAKGPIALLVPAVPLRAAPLAERLHLATVPAHVYKIADPGRARTDPVRERCRPNTP